MKIFIQNIDDKFVRGVNDASSNDIMVYGGDPNNKIYQLNYQYNFDSYIFCSDMLTKELYEFILEFAHQKKIVIYHASVINTEALAILGSICSHISHHNHPSVINIPLLINSHIFNNQNKSRSQDIVCFLDTYKNIPSILNTILYPNTKLPIKIFSKYIKHHQNLGYATELDKAQILNICDSYLVLDNDYVLEAATCGAKLVSIENNCMVAYSFDNNTISKTYWEFLKDILT